MLKDSLFDDILFDALVDFHGPTRVESELTAFWDDLRMQLEAFDRGDQWRRGVIALIIRAKKRLRELEDLK